MQTPGDTYAFSNCELFVGSVFADQYRVIEKIGSGGIGVVYKVKHILWDQEQALKVLPAGLTERKRFENQITALRSLRHANIIALHEFGIDKSGLLYIAMDLIEGRSLEQVLSESRNPVSGDASQAHAQPLQWTLAVALQLCDALAYAHENSIVHRDLKPSNIMITKRSDGTSHVTLLDFDLVKLINSSDGSAAPLTQPGELLGSAPYMSPEQCRGAEIDGRADIYSLGCVVFECLTGRPPHLCKTKIETMMHTLDAPVPTLAQTCAKSTKFPPEIERIVAKTLAKDANERYQSVNALRSDLEQFAETISAAGAYQRGRDEAWHARRRRLGVAAGIYIFCILMLALWVVRFIKPKTTPVRTSANTKVPPTSAEIAVESKIGFLHNRRLVWLTLSELEDDTDYRILHFPRSKIGKLVLSPDGPSTDAMGDVAIGNDDEVGLDVREFVPITELDRFGSDELRNSILLVYHVGDINLSHIVRLRGLHGLRLPKDEISDRGLEQIVRAYPSLMVLDLSGTKMSRKGIAQLESLSNLRTISIEHFSLAESSVLRSFKRAWSLCFRDCKLTGHDLQNLPNTGELRLLWLPQNPGISGRDLEHLCALTSLQFLDVSGCSIGPDSIVFLKRMKTLEHLRINLSRWNDKEKAALRAALPHCAIE